MEETWTIKRALDWTQGYLARKGDNAPRLSAEWLIGEATGHSRIELYTCFDEPLTPEERERLRGYVSRRGAGEPLQYISGHAAFRYITVKVRPGVLIPRPETEVLVSEALSLLPPAARRVALDSTIDAWEGDALRQSLDEAGRLSEQDDESAGQLDAQARQAVSEYLRDSRGGEDGGEPAPIKPARPLLVADICTGSGCIACSVAHERPDTRIIATDISPVAVELAKENAAELDLIDRVRVELCDLGAGVPAAALGRLDLVVSNPPYVPTAVLADIPREVSDFEPTLALDGGADGNDILRRLLPWTMVALRPGGGFAFELHETCLEAAKDLACAEGFTDVRIVTDLAGKPRVLTGRKADSTKQVTRPAGTDLLPRCCSIPQDDCCSVDPPSKFRGFER